MTAIYLTTTIPYVNARPHLGHALEFVQADVLARYDPHHVLLKQALDEVLERSKDIQFSSKTRFNTTRIEELEGLRAAFGLGREHGFRHAPWWRQRGQ